MIEEDECAMELQLDGCTATARRGRVGNSIGKVGGRCFGLALSLSVGEQVSFVWPALNQH